MEESDPMVPQIFGLAVCNAGVSPAAEISTFNDAGKMPATHNAGWKRALHNASEL